MTTKLRDWLFSRQRYWGEPFPILLDNRTTALLGVPARGAARRPARPRRLPPIGPPRAASGQGDRVGSPTRRSIAAKPTRCRSGRGRAGTSFATSIPRTTSEPWSRELEKYWMPVDLYVGGAEHAVLHLMYARFWHKVLFDRGLRQHPRAVQQAGQPGDDPRRNRVHRISGRRPAQWLSASGSRSRCRRGSLAVKLDELQVTQEGGWLRPGRSPRDPDRRSGPQDVEGPGERHQPRRRGRRIWRGQPPALRDVHGSARSGQTVEHEGSRGGLPFPRPSLADGRRRRRRHDQARPPKVQHRAVDPGAGDWSWRGRSPP